jgi:hypothetical protein
MRTGMISSGSDSDWPGSTGNGLARYLRAIADIAQIVRLALVTELIIKVGNQRLHHGRIPGIPHIPIGKMHASKPSS